MIIILNGPLGIGKTETSWQLLSLFDRAIMLDGDYLGAVTPFEIHDPQRVDYLHRTLQHLAAFHHQHGYRDFVINYVFEDPLVLADLCQKLSSLGEPVFTYRLTCDPDELERRVRQRGRGALDPGNLAWEVQRCRQLLAIQEAAARTGDLGQPLDTSQLNALQVAQAIYAASQRRLVT